MKQILFIGFLISICTISAFAQTDDIYANGNDQRGYGNTTGNDTANRNNNNRQQEVNYNSGTT